MATPEVAMGARRWNGRWEVLLKGSVIPVSDRAAAFAWLKILLGGGAC